MPSFKQSLCALLLAASSVSPAAGLDESFVKKQRERSLQGMLNNIGPNGKLVPGAHAGAVVASPSKADPNYFYTWTRDSALTLQTLIDEFIWGNKGLEGTIKDYVKAQAVLQTVANPSGNLSDGSGLGEPKFHVDLTGFYGSWGRPQRDGPAVRSIALQAYIKYLLQHGGKAEAEKVWGIVANDLAYIGQYWSSNGFDLWEEVNGTSFFTIQNQHRALVEGADVAKKLGKSCEACSKVAPELLCFLQSFWNGKTVVANMNTETKRSGVDANTLLGSIATFDSKASCDSPTFQPCSSKMLASHKVYVDSFRDIYDINSKRKEPGTAAACGRYAEDVWQGGNPWYLTTLAAAELLYDAVAQWKNAKQITVDSTSLPFFKDIVPGVKTQTYKAGARLSGKVNFDSITKAVTKYADGFVDVVKEYTPSDGSLAEQFLRNGTGKPASAIDLTWSYASFVTMDRRRNGQYPPSWGASGAKQSCGKATVKGTYKPATAAGAPAKAQCQVPVQFNVNATTYYGEDLYLLGGSDDTGSWREDEIQAMHPNNYTEEHPLWSATLPLLAGEEVNFKFVRQEKDKSFIYEDKNRTLTVPECGTGTKTVDASWDGKTGTAPASGSSSAAASSSAAGSSSAATSSSSSTSTAA